MSAPEGLMLLGAFCMCLGFVGSIIGELVIWAAVHFGWIKPRRFVVTHVIKREDQE